MTSELALAVAGPFHLQATVRLLQRRPANPVDRWMDGRYQRALDLGSGFALADVWNEGTLDSPKVRLSLRGRPGRRPMARAAAQVRRILGLDLSPAPVANLAASEPRLRGVLLALRGLRAPRYPTLMETFANVIPFQQVSLDAGVATVAKLANRLGPGPQAADAPHAFPTAEVIAAAPEEALRTCGLSANKARALKAVATLIAAGRLREEDLQALPTDAAQRRLIELPGIGPWSASLILLRGLGRLDAFPENDVGVARGLARLLDVRQDFDPAAFARPFGEQRGYLYFLSLGASLLDRGLIDPAPGQGRRFARSAQAASRRGGGHPEPVGGRAPAPPRAATASPARQPASGAGRPSKGVPMPGPQDWRVVEGLEAPATREDTHLLRDLVERYLESASEAFEHLEDGGRRGSFSELEHAARLLVEGSDALEAAEISHLARELERRARARDLAGVRAALPPLREAFLSARAALEEADSAAPDPAAG